MKTISAVAGWLAAAALLVTAIGCSSDEPPAVTGLAVELQEDGSTRLTWDAVSADATIEIRAALVPEALNQAEIAATVTGASSVTITDLAPDRRWYFDVRHAGGAGTVGATRHVPMQGSANFRDLGGYQTTGGQAVRWGLVFRSDALSELEPGDVALLSAMELDQIFDLRSDDEVTLAPDVAIDGVVATRAPIVLPVDLQDVLTGGVTVDEQFMTDVYKGIIDGNAALFADMFQALAGESGTRLVVHCTGGKDRTGIAAALLLGLLEVPRDTIVADYTLTDLYSAAIIERQRQVLIDLGLDPATFESLLVSPPAVMHSLLDHIESQHGSVAAYLETGGLGAEAAAEIRAALLE